MTIASVDSYCKIACIRGLASIKGDYHRYYGPANTLIIYDYRMYERYKLRFSSCYMGKPSPLYFQMVKVRDGLLFILNKAIINKPAVDKS